MFRKLFLVLVLALCSGNVSQKPQTLIACENECFYNHREDIVREVEKKFGNSYILAVHGNKPPAEVWRAVPDLGKCDLMQDRVDKIRKEFPDRPIVVWACNYDHARLKGKNVWYFTTMAWVVPDSSILFVHQDSRGIWMNALENRDVQRDYGGAGSVFEMVEGD